MVWLVIGAVVNVAVAWCACLWLSPRVPPSYTVPPVTDNTGRLTWPAPEVVPSEFPFPDMVTYHVWRPFFSNVYALRHISGAALSAEQVYCQQFRTVGWPARSLQSGQSFRPEEIRGRVLDVGSYALPAWLRKVCPRGYLATNVIWPGFALNTLFYALPIALLWLAPGQVRRRHRRRKGLCVDCGYPVADAGKPCPECGKIPSRSAAAPRYATA